MSSFQATEPRLIMRMNRREIRSSRAAWSIVAATVLLLAVLWLAVELVLSATGNSALLLSPTELALRTASLGTATIPAALTAAGGILVLAGIAVLALAILPGRKPRHIVDNDRFAVVVDGEVLAAAVSRTARTAAQLAPEQVTSSVGRKRIDVVVRPGSGRTVDKESVKYAVEREVSSYGLRQSMFVDVSTTTHRAVGS
ncbi:hypothetical protein [Arthrobacter sp.]|uniref:hypothetical protein n=1 Tax=Arthrobacter sp. TaxID=1667 RepID=UPI0026DF8821|nr:hypothetical protein [Arthrobacter sp.]MDO5754252.1 hypothetical protein [Arthrobacter sp.]